MFLDAARFYPILLDDIGLLTPGGYAVRMSLAQIDGRMIDDGLLDDQTATIMIEFCSPFQCAVMGTVSRSRINNIAPLTDPVARKERV
jgi:hypothetical protein